MKPFLLFLCSLYLAGCSLFPIEKVPNNTTQTTTQPNTATPEISIQRHDFDMYLNFEPYTIGNNFNFTGKVQNANSNNVTINNRDGNSLEYKLMKGNTSVFSNPVPSFYMTMKELGYLEVQYKDNIITSRATNIDLDWGDGSFSIPHPIVVSRTDVYEGYTFTDKGTYSLIVNVKYGIGNEIYNTEFTSEGFEVR